MSSYRVDYLVTRAGQVAAHANATVNTTGPVSTLNHAFFIKHLTENRDSRVPDGDIEIVVVTETA